MNEIFHFIKRRVILIHHLRLLSVVEVSSPVTILVRVCHAQTCFCIRVPFLILRKLAFDKVSLPYFKETHLSTRSAFLILRKLAFSKVSLPYFEETHLSTKSAFLILRKLVFHQSQLSLFRGSSCARHAELVSASACVPFLISLHSFRLRSMTAFRLCSMTAVAERSRSTETSFPMTEEN